MWLARIDNPEDRAAFAEAERELRRSRAAQGLLYGAIAMPSGVGLDWLIYPQQLGTLLTIRCLASAVLVAGLLAAVYVKGVIQRPTVFLVFSFTLILVPALAMSGMIYVTDGGRSTYYVGLMLMMVVVQLLGFGLVDSAIYCALTIAAYLFAVFAHGGLEGNEGGLIFAATFFLSATAILSSAVCFLNQRHRLSDFLLQRRLDVQNRKLQELDRLRAELLANVSHELRTPLALIIGPLDQLLHGGGIPDGVGQSLAMVRKNTDRLRLLVDDLVDVVRTEQATLRLRPEPIDAREFLLAIATTMRPQAQDRGLRLETYLTRAPLEINVDIDRMERVFINLLGNAFKFSPAESSVKLSLGVADGRAEIAVEDHGPGIKAEDQERIFERYYQSSTTGAQAAQGLGLGLALVHDIVTWHSGTVRVISEPGKGAKFVVSLPANVSAESTLIETTDDSALDPPSVAEPEPTETDVLVIDDEPDMRKFLASCLARDFRTATAVNGLTGIARAERLRPPVVLLDVMLPDINGLEVLRRLRQNTALAETRVIMITANLDENLKLDALRLGADDFLSKPFGVTEVKARVAGLLHRAKIQAELRHEKEELRRSLLKLQETESRLVQSEKMRAVGGLAAGLLHEINNPVNFTLMAVQALERDLAKGRDVGEIVIDIRDGIRRISDIITDLRAFAYPEQGQMRVEFPLADAVRTAVRFTGGICQKMRVEVELPEGLRVYASQSQITQILVNLLQNAAAAINHCRPPVQSPVITISAAVRGSRALVTVADNGPGIAPADLPHVCEPFFTKNDVGEGLGLGLSICHALVASHGGTLEVRSEFGRGVEVAFDLELRAVQGVDHGNAA